MASARRLFGSRKRHKLGTEEQLEKKENKEQKNKGHKLGTAEQLKKRKIKNIVKRIIFGVFSLNENKARQLFS